MRTDDHFVALESDDLDAHDEQLHDHDEMRGRFSDAISARQYMRAGRAIVTLVSLKTDTRFTYRLSVPEDGNCIFVALLVGQDNNSAYKYIGRIARDVFWAGRKNARVGDIAIDAPSVAAFAWVWRKLAQNVMPTALEIWHEGSCGRCGRRLTVPSSIAAGFGPECITKIN